VKNQTVIYVQGRAQSFTVRSGYSLADWLKDSHILYRQNGNNYYDVHDRNHYYLEKNAEFIEYGLIDEFRVFDMNRYIETL
jgi:hypothetical protein